MGEQMFGRRRGGAVRSLTKYTLVEVFCDLKKAFDTCNFDTVHGSVCEILNCVPQGFILGPWLFVLYNVIKDLPGCRYLLSILFPNDTASWAALADDDIVRMNEIVNR